MVKAPKCEDTRDLFDLFSDEEEVDLDADRDGATFDPERDRRRLNAQMRRVVSAMLSGDWRSLAELSHLAAAPEASVSARLRDLRKDRFGASVVERVRVEGGLYKYRLLASDMLRAAALGALSENEEPVNVRT